MKKAKNMLAAIAVLAVIGGALAFKARTFGWTIYTTTSQFIGAHCPIEKLNWTTTDQNPGTVKISVTTVPPTNAVGEICVLNWTKFEN